MLKGRGLVDVKLKILVSTLTSLRLNEFWAKPPVPDTHNFFNEVNGSFFCQPDKIKSEKWYRNIVSISKYIKLIKNNQSMCIGALMKFAEN